MPKLSRREFAALSASAALAYAGRLGAADPISAQDVIERIRKEIGVPWASDTVDGLKAGDPSTTVTGIVTTSMATMAVLRQAVAAGANFIVTAHPTFYSRADVPTPPVGRGGGAPSPDAVFAAKDEYIAGRKLVVFRLSDHWRQRQPDPRAQGLTAALGWQRYEVEGNAARLEVPTIRLDALVSRTRKALRSRGGIRVMGDAHTRVQRIGLLPGTTPIQAALQMLPEVDAIIAGEVREWESVEYVRDKIFSGAAKALILTGRVVSEEPGMARCAEWLSSIVSEVPIRHIGAGDLYWRPS